MHAGTVGRGATDRHVQRACVTGIVMQTRAELCTRSPYIRCDANSFLPSGRSAGSCLAVCAFAATTASVPRGAGNGNNISPTVPTCLALAVRTVRSHTTVSSDHLTSLSDSKGVGAALRICRAFVACAEPVRPAGLTRAHCFSITIARYMPCLV